MLQYLNQCSRGRGAWLLMALTAFILELVALWFQHVMLLQPCVMCIMNAAPCLASWARGWWALSP